MALFGKKKNSTSPPETAPKKPSPARVVRKQLDDLFEHGTSYTMSEMGLELEALFKEYPAQVLNQLVKRLNTEDSDEERWVAWAFIHLGKAYEGPVKKLTSVLKSKKKPFKSRMLAMTLLQQLGADVDFSHVQLTQDTESAAHVTMELLDDKIEEWLVRIAHAEFADQVIDIIFDLDDTLATMGDTETIPTGIITRLSELSAPEAVSLLQAIAFVSRSNRLAKKAERALERLQSKVLRAIPPCVTALDGPQFYRAYATDPIAGEPETLIFSWRTEGKNLMAFVFLLDVLPSNDVTVSDFFATRSVSIKEFKVDFLKKGMQKGVTFHDMQFISGQRLLKKALQGNKTYRKALPKLYRRYAHLIERWILMGSH
ncbi:MAG: hypothetical protein D6675_04620 [Gemmatimonadetes bacterium]|nr:MAG: hypothetical protein D6675_04620 [Gemmatimonadota bacterium]